MKTIPNDIFFAEVERMLAEGQSAVITVQGNSMRPFMRSGRTQVLLSPCKAEELAAGDVVLFRYRGRHILHRIVNRTQDRLRLAGDGNYRIFEECATADVVAKVVAVIDRKGRQTSCQSRRWRWWSGCWLGLHPFIRRGVLWIMRKSGLN